MESRIKKRKVTIVGAGAVGSTFAYALAIDGAADEIVLVDKQEDLAKGQALDLAHGRAFIPNAIIRSGDVSDYSDAQVIVITAGASQEKGDTRLDLLEKNIGIINSIVDDIVEQNSNAVLLVVTNPVDVLTYAALKRSGFDRSRVIGSGTVLDSSRFRHFLGDECGIDPRNVHAYILGEHGDSEFAAWSLSSIAGKRIGEDCFKNPEKTKKVIEEKVRNSAYHIIDYKGATNFAVGLAMVEITKAVLKNRNSVLTVSVKFEGEYGLDDVCLSVPCVVNQNGAEKMLVANFEEDEFDLLKKSSEVLKKEIEKVFPGDKD